MFAHSNFFKCDLKLLSTTKIIQYLKLIIQLQRHSKEPNTLVYNYSYIQSDEQKIDLCVLNVVLISPILKLYLSN